MVENIAKKPLDADLKDLAQMVYVILLDYDERKLVDLWEHNQMNFFVARIIINQYRSSNSPFHKLVRKYSASQHPLYTDDDKKRNYEDRVNVSGNHRAEE